MLEATISQWWGVGQRYHNGLLMTRDNGFVMGHRELLLLGGGPSGLGVAGMD